MFKSMKWALLILMNVAMAPVGGLLALLFTGTNFSVSSGVGFLALFGVSVQTGVIMVEYINQLRVRGHTIDRRGRGRRGAEAASHHDDHAGGHARPAAGGTVARHRIGFAAAVRHRDRRRLMAALLMSIFLLPTLYVWIAGNRLGPTGTPPACVFNTPRRRIRRVYLGAVRWRWAQS
jgi:heavy metal efflux system protein